MADNGKHRRFKDTEDAAEFLNVSRRTLEGWRLRGEGPVYSKLGKAVRYDVADLEAFANGGRVGPAGAR